MKSINSQEKHLFSENQFFLLVCVGFISGHKTFVSGDIQRNPTAYLYFLYKSDGIVF